MFTCDICLEEKNLYAVLKCKDKYCMDCLKTYVQSELKNFNLEIKCPNHKTCKHIFNKNEIVQFIDSKESCDKLNEIKQVKYLDGLNIFYCKCGEAYEVEEKRNVFCMKCLKESCSSCSLTPHSGECIRVPKDQLELVEKGIIKHCPKCKIIIEKNNGCNHMTCAKCKHEFYWDTLEKFDPRKVRDTGLGRNFRDPFLTTDFLNNSFQNHPRSLNNFVFGNSFPNTSNQIEIQSVREPIQSPSPKRSVFVPPTIPPRPAPMKIIPSKIRSQPTETKTNFNSKNFPTTKKELIDLFLTNRKRFDEICRDINVSKTGIIVDYMLIDMVSKVLKIN